MATALTGRRPRSGRGVDSAQGARRLEVSAQVTDAPHRALGLATDDLLRMQRQMVTARLIDEAALRQNRMGRAPFVVPVSGHEGCQDRKSTRLNSSHRL